MTRPPWILTGVFAQSPGCLENKIVIDLATLYLLYLLIPLTHYTFAGWPFRS